MAKGKNGKFYLIVHVSEEEFDEFKRECEKRQMTQTKLATALFKLGRMKIEEAEKSGEPILIV